ncbi:MAG TPA: hypothetical protein VH206_11345 [Xanthobacteraceae bacterium]|jgi:hypothetical protein|nr:hypothetical protein [Xanthobacteraceae bacterium]
MNATDTLGYAASSAVLVTFLMTRMTPLRVVAIVSNVLFIAFGFMQHVYPVFFLHLVLLPVNLWRLCNINAAAMLQPVMARPLRCGTWIAAGMVTGMLSVSTVLAFGIPEYDNLAKVYHVSLSFSQCNPVKNALRVIKGARTHIFAGEKPSLQQRRANNEPIAI